MSREKFYKKQILKYINNKKSKILVLGAGKLDQKIFKNLGFVNVTYTNIENSKEDNLNQFNNIHDIKLKDNSFEFCVAHACIHHSSKPHLAILELFRVCSEGSLIIEANDSLLTRIACKLKLSEEYELSAVEKNVISGGVDNTNIPNYVYRWTEREVMKLMKSFRPDLKHKIDFDYAHQLKFTNSRFINLLFDIFFQFLENKKIFYQYIFKKMKIS